MVEHLWLLMTRPKRNGGLGIFDFNDVAIKAFVKPFTKSIHMASQGIKLGVREDEGKSDIIFLGIIIENIYLDWEDDNASVFSKYREAALIFIKYIELPTKPPQSDLQFLAQHADIEKTCAEIVLKNNSNKLFSAFRLLYPNDKAALPTITNEITSLPLLSISRIERYMRLTVDKFRTLFKWKLRIPLLNPYEQAPICKCGASIDSHLDHCHSCQHFTLPTRTSMHNVWQATLFTIIKVLLPLVSDTSVHDIHHEPINLIHNAPALHPADICIEHPPHKCLPFTKTLINVTQTPIIDKEITVLNTYREQSDFLIKRLEEKETSKFNSERYHKGAANYAANEVQKNYLN